MLLVILTWICIDFHDQNLFVAPIEAISSVFCMTDAKQNKAWLLHLLYLSFSKILYQASLLLATRMIVYQSLARHGINNMCPNIEMGNVAFHAIYGIVGLISVIFNLLPGLILTFYPFRYFRVLLSRLRLV